VIQGDIRGKLGKIRECSYFLLFRNIQAFNSDGNAVTVPVPTDDAGKSLSRFLQSLMVFAWTPQYFAIVSKVRNGFSFSLNVMDISFGATGSTGIGDIEFVLLECNIFNRLKFQSLTKMLSLETSTFLIKETSLSGYSSERKLTPPFGSSVLTYGSISYDCPAGRDSNAIY